MLAPTSTLPADIWSRIISHCNEEPNLNELWMSHRFVNRTFRDAVETLFQERHLRKTWINYDLAGGDGNDDGVSVLLDVHFEFLALSTDNQTAIFQAEKGDANYTSTVADLLRASTTKDSDGKLTRESILTPKHALQVHREVNDTPIPSLQIDYDSSPDHWKLSCDWKAMYTRFYGEERHYNRLMDNSVGEYKATADGMKEKMERGEISMGDVFKGAFELIGKSNRASYKKARRARISRMSGELDWENLREGEAEGEEKRLKALDDARQEASTEDDSDFDGERSDDDSEVDDSDDEEDREWEDASESDEDEGGSLTEEQMIELIDRMDAAMGAGEPPRI